MSVLYAVLKTQGTLKTHLIKGRGGVNRSFAFSSVGGKNCDFYNQDANLHKNLALVLLALNKYSIA